MVAIIDAEIEQYDAAVSSEPSSKLYGPTTDIPWWIWRRVKEAILRHGALRIIMAAAWDECFETIQRDARIDWCVAEDPKNQIGRAHVRTAVTLAARMTASAR